MKIHCSTLSATMAPRDYGAVTSQGRTDHASELNTEPRASAAPPAVYADGSLHITEVISGLLPSQLTTLVYFQTLSWGGNKTRLGPGRGLCPTVLAGLRTPWLPTPINMS